MYKYEDFEEYICTFEGQEKLFYLLDMCMHVSKYSDCISINKLVSSICGDSWKTLACIDRLVELGYLSKLGDNVIMFTDKLMNK